MDPRRILAKHRTLTVLDGVVELAFKARYKEPIKPDLYYSNVTDFHPWEHEGIKGVVFDLENTLAPLGRLKKIHPYEGVEDYLIELKEHNISAVILSNKTARKHRGRKQKFIENIESRFGIPVVNTERYKPSAYAFYDACHELGLEHGQVAMVGDWIATDILGARNAKAGLKVLVDPMDPESIVMRILFRPFGTHYRKKQNIVYTQ